MAETKTAKTRTSKSRSAPKRNADTSLLARTGRTVKQRPYVSAAIATGAVTVAAAAAAGAFFFSRKDKSFGEFTARVKARIGDANDMVRDRFAKDRTQSEIAEEAFTLKESGQRDIIQVDPLVQDQLKASAVTH